MILEVCWGGLWTLSLGLSRFHGHGSWLVCEVALIISTVLHHDDSFKEGNEDNILHQTVHFFRLSQDVKKRSFLKSQAHTRSDRSSLPNLTDYYYLYPTSRTYILLLFLLLLLLVYYSTSIHSIDPRSETIPIVTPLVRRPIPRHQIYSLVMVDVGASNPELHYYTSTSPQPSVNLPVSFLVHGERSTFIINNNNANNINNNKAAASVVCKLKEYNLTLPTCKIYCSQISRAQLRRIESSAPHPCLCLQAVRIVAANKLVKSCCVSENVAASRESRRFLRSKVGDGDVSKMVTFPHLGRVDC